MHRILSLSPAQLPAISLCPAAPVACMMHTGSNPCFSVPSRQMFWDLLDLLP